MKRFLLVILIFVFASASASALEIFSDDFESGGVSAWSSQNVEPGNTVVVNNAAANEGAYGLNVRTTGSNDDAHLRKSISGTKEIYARVMMKLASDVSNGYHQIFLSSAKNADSNYIGSLALRRTSSDPNNNLFTFAGGSFVDTGINLQTDRWYCVEMQNVVNLSSQNNGRIKVWVDDVLVANSQKNLGTVDMKWLRLGADGPNIASNYYFDDFKSDTERIGCPAAPPAFDFSVSANPTSATVAQTGSAATAVDVNLISGTSENVALSYSGCPASATCSFNPASGNPTYSSTFNVATSAATPAGTYPILIRGTSSSLARNVTYTLTVTDSQPVSNASANPTSGLEPLTVTFTGAVSGGNAPLTYSWNFMDGFTSTQQNPQHTFNAGAYNVAFTATDNDGDFSTSYVAISVNPAIFDFSLSANPDRGTVAPSGNINSTIMVTLTSGSTQSVLLYVASGCPSSTSCLLNPVSGNPTYASLLSIQTNSTVLEGLYDVNITGIGGGKERSTIYLLNVSSPSAPSPPPEGNCTDTDGGQNIYQQGTATDQDESQTDLCSSSTRLLEYWCRDGVSVEGYYTDCPSGYSCINGACV